MPFDEVLTAKVDPAVSTAQGGSKSSPTSSLLGEL